MDFNFSGIFWRPFSQIRGRLSSGASSFGRFFIMCLRRGVPYFGGCFIICGGRSTWEQQPIHCFVPYLEATPNLGEEYSFSFTLHWRIAFHQISSLALFQCWYDGAFRVSCSFYVARSTLWRASMQFLLGFWWTLYGGRVDFENCFIEVSKLDFPWGYVGSGENVILNFDAY